MLFSNGLSSSNHRSPLLSLLVIFCLSVVPVLSREKKQTRKTDDDEVIRTTSNYVNLDVTVRDKKGKPITDLKAEDFSITENGVRQKIEFFEPPLANIKDAEKPAITVGAGGPQKPSGLPRNIISLVFDGQTTDASNLKYVRDGVTRYIRERISDNDSVALFAITGGLQLLQPFTQDKEKLVSAVDRAYKSSTGSKAAEQRSNAEAIASLRDQVAGASTEPVTVAAGGSAAAQAMITQRVLEQYVQLRSALSIQQARPILAAFAAICEGLRAIPGKKTVVVFSQGFVAPQVLDWQVQSTIDIANRANVAIYVIDSSGLTGGTPQSGALVPSSPLAGISAAASQESRIRAGAGESVFDITRQEGTNRQQDLLYRISGDTGGQFIKNTNDIASGLDRIDGEIRSRYTLAYHSTDSTFDGTFRKVKIDVSKPDVNVISRSGYYAIPPTQIVPFSPDERKMLANFSSTAAHPTLPLSLELTSFRSQPGYYIVPLSFEIPPESLEFRQKGDSRQLELNVLGVVRRQKDNQILSRLGGTFNVGLTATQYESILHDKVFYRQDLELETGAYTVELMVTDRLSGKNAALRQALVLPLADEEFTATSAVLSHHAARASQNSLGTGDILSEGNVQIRPAPSHEFRPTDNLIIFFKLYNAKVDANTAKPLVRVTVSVMKDGRPALKPLDYELTQTVSEPVAHLTFAKYVTLKGLAPGKYSANIEINDMVENKIVKQNASFVIVP